MKSKSTGPADVFTRRLKLSRLILVLGRMSLLRISVTEKRIPVLPELTERMAEFWVVKPVRKKSEALLGCILNGRSSPSKYLNMKSSALGPQLALVPEVLALGSSPL